MINSVYGKTIENLRKKINVRLVNSEKEFLKYTSRPTHITHKIIDKNYAAIHEIKPVLALNKSIFVGFTVLELRKWLMYDFPYNFFIKSFDAELLLAVTDSLTYEIDSEDAYEEFFKQKHLFDFRNYPRFFDPTDKNVTGKGKEVFQGKAISDSFRLKSKMHSMKTIDSKESNTVKGVNIAPEFNEYKDTLFNKKVLRYKIRRIQGEKHKLETYETNKISLCFDDKRFVRDDGIHTPAYFVKVLRKQVLTDDHGKEQTITSKKDSKIFSRIVKDSHN